MLTIFNIETGRRRFLKVSAALFLVLPIALSMVMLRFLPDLPPMQGFSAVGSGFVGYVIYAAYSLLKRKFEFVKTSLLGLMLIINFLELTILNSYGTELTILISVLLCFTLFVSRKELVALGKESLAYFKKKSKRKNLFGYIYIWSVLALSIVMSFSLPFIVPVDFIQESAITNILAHYLGWVLGFSIPLTFDGIRFLRKTVN
jgi:hypothetical protein